MDIRVVGNDQNHSEINAVTVLKLKADGSRNAIPMAQVNASGDIVNPGGGGSGGDGAILDGADTSIKATVKDYTRSNPLTVVLVNSSGDAYNASSGGSGGDGAINDGVDSNLKATVKDYANANPLTVVLVNVSGDAYNSGGGAGGDGAINDGANSAIKATVLNDATSIPSASDKALVIQFADGPARRVGRVSQDGAWSMAITGDITLQQSSSRILGRIEGPIGVQIVGSSISTFALSGDSQINSIQRGGWAVSVTGDVLLRANPGVNIGNIGSPIGVQVLGGVLGGTVALSGDTQVNANQRGAWATAITGDVILQQSSSRIIGRIEGPIGVQIVGSSVATVGLSGDSLINAIQRGAWAVAVTGDVLLRANPGVNIGNIGSPIGVQILGGSVGGTIALSGDTQVNANQRGAWATAITGDVILQQNSNRVLGRIEGPLGVQVVGSSVATIGISGDQMIGAIQRGAWAVAVTGDVSTTPKAGSTWPVSIAATVSVAEQSKTGTHVAGGLIGVTGDVNVTATDFDIRNLNPAQDSVRLHGGIVGVSGDRSITDGADPTIESTVRDYANANPLAVALTNASGDTYSPTPREPEIVTRAGRITSAGTTTIAGPYNGRVIKVTSIELQGESASDTMMRLGSAASGDPLSTRWIFNAREGVAQAVSQIGGGYITKTNLNQALVVEHFDANVLNYCIRFCSGDAN